MEWRILHEKCGHVRKVLVKALIRGADPPSWLESELQECPTSLVHRPFAFNELRPELGGRVSQLFRAACDDRRATEKPEKASGVRKRVSIRVCTDRLFS